MIQRIVSFSLLAVLVLVTLVGCAPPPSNVAPESPLATRPAVTPIPIDESGRVIAQASNEFGFALFERLRAGESEEDGAAENVFISPLSIYLALAMVYNGASGETAMEMAQVLGVDGMALEQVNAGSFGLQQTLLSAPGVELLIGNSTWVQEGLQLQDAFAAIAEQYYNAEAAEVDFQGNPEEAAARINSWASDQTNGLIEEIIGAADASKIVMALLNAIYFKGDWAEQFEREATQSQPFYLADGSEMSVPMMHQTESFPIYIGETYDALALPYVGERARMVIVLPHADVTLAAVLEDFGPAQWQATLDGLSEQNVRVGLPRFEMEYSQELKKFLVAMGMPLPFDKLVTDRVLWIEFVKHKAVMRVDEEGTTAAAVTAVGMAVSEPPSFIVDRPFFFAIQDSYSGAVLFMGAVYAPEPLEAE